MPYCRSSYPKTGARSGSANNMTKPRKALKVMAQTTSSGVARIAGATADMAELPQIELPQAIRTAMRVPMPNKRQIA